MFPLVIPHRVQYLYAWLLHSAHGLNMINCYVWSVSSQNQLICKIPKNLLLEKQTGVGNSTYFLLKERCNIIMEISHRTHAVKWECGGRNPIEEGKKFNKITFVRIFSVVDCRISVWWSAQFYGKTCVTCCECSIW